jgi:hypothetical protein
MLRNAVVVERYAQTSVIDGHTNARRSDARAGVTLLFGDCRPTRSCVIVLSDTTGTPYLTTHDTIV